jgi:hypothetical protein
MPWTPRSAPTWLNATTPPSAPRPDGKALSGSAHRQQRHRHLLSAVTHAPTVTLAQREVGDKTNETAAFRPLLEPFDLAGAVVTFDALNSVKDQVLEFGVGQALVERLPGRGDGGGVVFALADVRAEEDVDVAGVDHVQAPPSRSRPALPGHRAATSTFGELFRPWVKPVLKPLISGPSMPPDPVTPPPGS